MVVITVQAYTKAGVHTIKVGNRELLLGKMIDVQKGLGLKNIPHLSSLNVCMRLNILQKNKKENI